MNGVWSNRYIGLGYLDCAGPSDAADCWGLARIVYRAELGIDLPDYVGDAQALERAEIAALVAGASTSPLWRPVAAPAQPFDVAVFRRGRLATHIGIVIRDGMMLHMGAGDRARVEDYRAGRWQSRFPGVFRWREHTREDPLQNAPPPPERRSDMAEPMQMRLEWWQRRAITLERQLTEIRNTPQGEAFAKLRAEQETVLRLREEIAWLKTDLARWKRGQPRAAASCSMRLAICASVIMCTMMRTLRQQSSIIILKTVDRRHLGACGMCTEMHNPVTEQIRQAVEKAMKADDVGARRFEDLRGLPKWSLRGLLDPKRVQAPSVDRAKELCEALGLEFYIGPPRERSPAPAADPADFVRIPLFDAHLAAGTGADNGPDAVIDSLAFRRDWLRGLNIAADTAVLARATGDSMFPTIQPGDMLLIDRARAEVPVRQRAETDTRPAPIYALVDDGAARVKRVERPEAGIVVLTSDNPAYGPDVLTGAKVQTLAIIGRVMWWGHTYRE